MLHLRPSQEQDQALMDAIRTHGPIPKGHLTAINRVRCHLQLFFLADITTGDGQTIHHSYLHSSTVNIKSQWEWHSECPCPSDYRLWHRYVSSLLNATSTLHQPLGAWLTKSHLHWRWFYSRSTDRIYELIDNTWSLYDRLPHVTRSSIKFSLVTTSPCTPFNIVSTTVQVLSPELIIWQGAVSSLDYYHLPESTVTPDPVFWVLKECHILNHRHQEWLLNGLSDGTLWCVCDG